MNLLFRPSVTVFSIFLGLALLDSALPIQKQQILPETSIVNSTQVAAPKIQAAILLDVSSSMNGLIDQAKAQLWNMVTVMGRAKCNAVSPQIEIALYEYGRDQNDPKQGYIKQISGFTSDLDSLSQELFKLTTYGGAEYCGQVILTSLNELKWSPDTSNYKVIFIAGNEDFLQGSVTYSKACEEARKKGVIVNTIYCGDKAQGIREHWNLGGECGQGSFTNIDHNAKIDDIPTPYDSTLFVLNGKLNNTYIGYGVAGTLNIQRQKSMDEKNHAMNVSAAAKRTSVKGNKQLYNNSSWDLVDAVEKDKELIDKIDISTLSDTLKTKSRTELKGIVVKKAEERGLIQKQIATANIQRENYIAAEKKKNANAANEQTLETEVEKIIKSQARRFNMVIE